MNQLVLASASPRRKELLSELGVHFRVVSADIDETPLLNENPSDYVARLALEKSLAVLAKVAEHETVLGADTSVILDGAILGKPVSEQNAVDMLMSLSGRWHKVLSGVSIVNSELQKTIIVQANVEFCTLTEAMCRTYWQTNEPQDKAGAYAIQGKGARFVKQIQGSYSAIVGLPVYETAQLLDEVAIATWSF